MSIDQVRQLVTKDFMAGRSLSEIGLRHDLPLSEVYDLLRWTIRHYQQLLKDTKELACRSKRRG